MIIVAMGVSGAGKSTLGRALAERLGCHFEEGDEWHAPASVEKMRRGEPLSEDDRGPWLARLNRSVREWIAAKQDVVLACSALRRSHRQALRSGCDPRQLRFVFLDGTYEQVDRQLHARTGHFMPAALLRSQFDVLEPPGPAEAIRIEVGTPIDRAVDAVLEELRKSERPA